MNRLTSIHELIEKYGLLDKSRRRDVLFKRYYLYNELRTCGLSLSEIGRVFDKNHATILHGLRVHKDLTSYRDTDYLAETCALQAYLDGAELPDISKVFKTQKDYDLKVDILKAHNMVSFKRIQRRIKMGFYEEKEEAVQLI
jgi:uncharacterized C2H2 Zn-finger protein